LGSKLIDRLDRLTFRLPRYRALARRLLARPSEISLREARFLGELVRRAPPERPIVEIGTLFGSSTRVLAMFKAPGTPLITVDSFRWNPHGLRRPMHAAITREVLREAIDEHDVRLMEMDKGEFYRTYVGPSPGLVFLDAHHGYESTLEDIRWAQSAGAEIVCGHDYREQFPGVIRAVEECGGAEQVVGTVFVLKRAMAG
jgi:predicted O-methyltransferase YrrM